MYTPLNTLHLHTPYIHPVCVAIANASQKCLVGSTDMILNRGSMACIGVSLVACASMIRVFGAERLVFWRESAALPQPKHTLAYFIGKDVSMLPQTLLAPLFFDLIFHALTSPRASFGAWYLVFLGLYYCAMGYSYLVSIVAPPSLCQLVGVVAIFSNAMFAGGMPTLKQLENKWPPLCYMPSISFMRYVKSCLVYKWDYKD